MTHDEKVLLSLEWEAEYDKECKIKIERGEAFIASFYKWCMKNKSAQIDAIKRDDKIDKLL